MIIRIEYGIVSNGGLVDDDRWHRETAVRRRAIHRRRLGQLVIVVGAATLGYWEVFGSAIVSALGAALTFGGEAEGGYVPTEYAVTSTAWTVAIVVVVLGAQRIVARWWPGIGVMPWSRDRVPVAAVCGSLGLVIAACAFGAQVIFGAIDGVGLLPADIDYEIETAGVWWSAIGAGIGEEVLVLAVPVMVLRFYRVPTTWAIWILLALRVAYHLYYNVIGVWWLIPWALIAALVYWCWPDPRILAALIVEHIAYDVLVFAQSVWFYIYAGVGVALVVAATMMNPAWYRVRALVMPSIAWRTAVSGYAVPKSPTGLVDEA